MEQKVAQDSILESWSQLLEMRGVEPEGHAQRTLDLTLNLAQQVGVTGKKLKNVYRGVFLHYIGKLLIPDSILFKNGKLTNEE
jgi:response regulator RpfG family c-di-GMP phosphodiesterase